MMQSPTAYMLEQNLESADLFEDTLFSQQLPVKDKDTASLKLQPSLSLGKLIPQSMGVPMFSKYALSDESETDDADTVAADIVKIEPQIAEDTDEEERISNHPMVRVGRRRPKAVTVRRTSKRPASVSQSADSDSDVEALLNSLPKSKAGRKKKGVTSNMTKNALAARENRERKKKYIEDLEAAVRALNAENKALKKRQEGDQQKITSLTQAVKYYTSVISNIEEIRGLVQKVASNPMNTPPADHDYGQQDMDAQRQPGVCLHVAGPKMALKVCAKCSLSEDPVL